MNVKSKILKIRNLPQDGEELGRISSKPYLFIIIFLFIGAGFLMTKYYLIGIIVFVLFFYNLIAVKDVVLVRFYKEYVFFYLNNGKDECFLLFWEEVDKWSIETKRSELPVLTIVLKNAEVFSIRVVSAKKIQQQFQEHVLKNDEEIMKQHAL